MLISVLIFSCWAYYIKCEGFSNVAYAFLSKYPTVYFVLGTLILVAIVSFFARKILKMAKEPMDD